MIHYETKADKTSLLFFKLVVDVFLLKNSILIKPKKVSNLVYLHDHETRFYVTSKQKV